MSETGQIPTDGSGASPSNRWVPLLLIVVTLIAMGRLCAAEFVYWDDHQTLFENPKMIPPTMETLAYYWTHQHMGLYIPVTYTVWSGLAAIAQVDPGLSKVPLNPWMFHSANLLIHLINVLLVYQILKLLLPRDRTWAAAVGAMVFGVHPVQVETVGWISGGKDLLCGMFVLLAVWQYLLAIETQNQQSETGSNSGIRNWHYWLGMGCMLLGMLSKPTAVVTPVILVMLDRFAVRRRWGEVARSVWPWVLLAVPCMVWAKLVQTVPPFAPMWARPLIAGDAIAFYLAKVLWPTALRLDYERNPAALMSHAGWWVTAGVPVVLAAVLLARGKRWPVLVAAAGVFVAGVGPVLGLTPFMYQGFSTTADHYLYIPMLGVGLTAAWGMTKWDGGAPKVAAGVVIGVLTCLSAVQAGAWQDTLRLWKHGLAVKPDSYAAQIHVAAELELKAEREPEHRDAMLAEAESLLVIADRQKPTLFNRFNIAIVMIKRGKTQEAIQPLRDAIALYDPREKPSPQLARAHHLLGAGLWKEGKRQEGLEHFRKAVEFQPGDKEFVETLKSAEASMRAAAAAATTRASTREAAAGGAR